MDVCGAFGAWRPATSAPATLHCCWLVIIILLSLEVCVAPEPFDLRDLAGRIAILQPPPLPGGVAPEAQEQPDGDLVDRVWRAADGRHVFWSSRLGVWLWANCGEYIGWQYSIEWNVRHFFEQNPWVIAPGHVASDADDADRGVLAAFVEHCFTNVYTGVRGNGLSHDEALREADESYLAPLVRHHLTTRLGRPLAGRRSVVLSSSFDVGREDFPQAAALIADWTVLSLQGDSAWLQAAGIYAIGEALVPPGVCEEAQPQDAWMPSGVAAQRQDTVLPVPCRHAWDPERSGSDQRPLLGVFAGSLNSCTRRWLFDLFGSAWRPESLEQLLTAQDTASTGTGAANGIWVFNGSLGASPPDDSEESFDPEAPAELLYRSTLWASQFCLVLNGSSSVNNVRLIEAIQHGCIPAIVADRFQPPFHRMLQWADFSVFLRTRELPFLPQILSAISPEVASRKRRLLAEVAPYLDYRQQHLWNALFSAALRTSVG
eukprot:TRINITY_DN63588_c0_g1_i1.p1 TRINITY_DN63588_c0_g1~~TRINITY_DN63588_c0_g1_i1.p1  ORF type:complete len:488 (+),score=108.62 TRINITY_DN63588_c0_g1_i1:84-1547(+)